MPHILTQRDHQGHQKGLHAITIHVHRTRKTKIKTNGIMQDLFVSFDKQSSSSSRFVSNNTTEETVQLSQFISSMH